MPDTPGTVNFPSTLDTVETLIQTKNNASTILSVTANDSAATLEVASTAAFPATGALTVDGEIIFYTGTTATTFTGCIRGRDNTAPAAHAAGALVEGLIVSAHHSTLVSAIINTETRLGSGTSIQPTAGKVLKGTGTGTSEWSDLGTGSANQVTFWSAANVLAGSNNLYWDSTNNRLGLGTTGPTDTLHVGGTGRFTSRVGIGAAPAGTVGLLLSGALTSGTTEWAFAINSTVGSGAPSAAYGARVALSTVAAAITITNLHAYGVSNAALGAGSAVTNQYGYHTSNLTAGANNYGFYSGVTVGTNRWGFYSGGDANNYFAGNVGLGTTSPSSLLHVNGSMSIKRTAVSANYTVLTTDLVVAVTSTAAARTITLPAAATAAAGKLYIIKDESGGAATNNITIAPGGSETIDGAASKVISSNYGAVALYTNGSNWFSW